MICDALGKNELPTAVGFVNTKPNSNVSRSHSTQPYMASTINNREPLPSYTAFEYKKPMDLKQSTLWNKQIDPQPAGYGNFGP